MDHQLKQTAFFGTNGLGQNFTQCCPLQRHYKAGGTQAPSPDIECRDVIRWPSKAAAETQEFVSGWPVAFGNVAATWAFSAGVARIDEDYGDPFEGRFVFDQSTQLRECPIRHPGPLAPSNLDPIPNAREVFEGDQTSAAFGVGHDGFRDNMVGVALEPRLLSCGSTQRTFGGASVGFLQGTAAFMVPGTNLIDVCARERSTVVVCSEIDYSKINSESIGDTGQGSVRHLTSSSQYPLAADETEVDLALRVTQQSARSRITHKRNAPATANCPNRDGVLPRQETEDPDVVGLRGVAPELRGVTARRHLEGIGDLVDAADRCLCRQIEALPKLRVTNSLEASLASYPVPGAQCGEPSARGIAALQSVAQLDFIFRQQPDCCDELQDSDDVVLQAEGRSCIDQISAARPHIRKYTDDVELGQEAAFLCLLKLTVSSRGVR
jgi:hypothetical protein